MTAQRPVRVTRRQADVLRRVDARMPIKVIAAEMGVSESRINQHIRALKDAFGVQDLGALVTAHRELGVEIAGETPSRKAVYTKRQVSGQDGFGPEKPRVDPGELVFSDAATFPLAADWEGHSEPQVVPGVLNGRRAVATRLAAIVAMAFGIVAAIVLTVAASVSLTEAFDGVARVPVEELEPAD